jgi:hypothetical protein
MAELKSLAHPEWPYTGTPHEWRGFVKAPANEGRHYAPITPIEPRHVERFRELKAVYQEQNFGSEKPTPVQQIGTWTVYGDLPKPEHEWRIDPVSK